MQHLVADSAALEFEHQWAEPKCGHFAIQIDSSCADLFYQEQWKSEIEMECMAAFAQFEQQQALERKFVRRKRTHPEAAGESDAMSAHKKRRAPKSKLPHRDAAYVCALRSALHCIYRGTYDEPATDWNWGAYYVHIERALLHLLFLDGHFASVKTGIEQIFRSVNCSNWPLVWYSEIQTIWDETLYHVVGFYKRREEMTPVNTFRIRCKYPSPLQERVGKSRYNISERASEQLRAFYERSVTGRPNKSEKALLSRQTGLSLETVGNWFKNRRQRDAKRTSQSGRMSCRVSQSSSLASLSFSDDHTPPQPPAEEPICPYMKFDQLVDDPTLTWCTQHQTWDSLVLYP